MGEHHPSLMCHGLPSRYWYLIYTPENRLRSMECFAKGHRASRSQSRPDWRPSEQLVHACTTVPPVKTDVILWRPRKYPTIIVCFQLVRAFSHPLPVFCLLLPIDLCWCGWGRCQTWYSSLRRAGPTNPGGQLAPRSVCVSFLF